MNKDLNRSISKLGEALSSLVEANLQDDGASVDPATSEVIAAYRAVCDDFAAENLETQASIEVLQAADAIANELTMCAVMQPSLGVEQVLLGIEAAYELPASGLKRVIREMTINLAATSVNAHLQDVHNLEDLAAAAVQEKMFPTEGNGDDF